MISLDAPPMSELNTNKTGWLDRVRGQRVVGNIRYFISDIKDFAMKILEAVEDEESRNEKIEYIKSYRFNYHYESVYRRFLDLLEGIM